MKFSTVIGGGLVFIAGMGTGVYIACKAAVVIDEKICKGKLSEKFLDATSEKVTNYIHKKFEPKRFKPREFKYSRHDCENVIFETRTDAEEVLHKFNETISEYGVVTVADLCDFVGLSSTYSETMRGWKEEISDEAIHVERDGWMIDFPEWRTL